MNEEYFGTLVSTQAAIYKQLEQLRTRDSRGVIAKIPLLGRLLRFFYRFLILGRINAQQSRLNYMVLEEMKALTQIVSLQAEMQRMLVEHRDNLNVEHMKDYVELITRLQVNNLLSDRITVLEENGKR